MKIGIITFHKAINYGAILQTYALHKIIESMGTSCEIIDYECSYIEEMYKPFNKKRIKSIKTFLSSIVYVPTRIYKNNKFHAFQKNNIKFSERIKCKEQLIGLNKNYDQFITGSDQVWNLECTNGDTSYFLDFVRESKKKNSYAASLGINSITDEYQRENYKKLISNFNKISVRERQGADIISELVNREVGIHLDPTLLLDKEEWLKLCKQKNENNNYILIYLMAHSPSIIKFAEGLAEKTGCKIIHINSNLTKKSKGKYVRTAGPEEFLTLFAGAKYIVTNSFHGTAFSINFNKSFFVELLPPPAKVNSRLENIMDLLDLREREIINGNNENIYQSIDYDKVNKKLKQEREKSISYLNSIIEGNNE